MRKILIVDTYYPEFLGDLPAIPADASYSVELRRLLDLAFGTADFYSHNLRGEGWDVADVIANYSQLQELWLRKHGRWTGTGRVQAVVLEQIEEFKPDVVFMQDLSFFGEAELEQLRRRYLLAGQCSCPMPNPGNVSKFHVLFTSFPHYLDKFRELGVEGEYLPLAFDERMVAPAAERDIDISFVGGAGKNLHWSKGTDVLEEVAHQFGGRFHWYGYGQTNPYLSAALRACWKGSAWGREMYSIYSRSKIVINRHGEVAAGFANNLRMYEATGCGALLMTEEAPNLFSLFRPGTVGTYRNAADLCEQMHFFLSNEEKRQDVAIAGQAQTLVSHTYREAMSQVSANLNWRLTARGVPK